MPICVWVLTIIIGLTTAVSARDIVVAIGGEPDTGFDPVQGWGDYGSPLFQSSLLKLDADLNIVGDLATEWTLSEDKKTWVIRLREDARFSNGTPVTAEDVAFTYNTARDAGGLVDMTVLREARATGPLSVEIELTEPRITFIRRLTTLGIVPQSSYAKDYGRAPVGSGPFQMVEWREGETLIVEPNPYWFGGEVGFDRISFIFGDEDAAVAMARSGEAQLVAVPPSQADDVPDGMYLIEVESVDNRGLMFPMVPATGETTQEGAPIGNDVTSDRAIRVAVNQGLDREALVALALNGHGKPAFGPADDLPWDNPDAHIPGNDIAAAIETLERAGWLDNNGSGLRKKDGIPAQFKIVYPAADSVRQALALGASKQLKALGIDAQPSGRSWDEIPRLMHSNVVVFGWGAHDPSEMFNLYSSNKAGVATFNPGFYANAAVDAAFAKAEAADGFEASLPHWKAAQWDGTTGFGSKGDAAWAWMVNLEHDYFVADCLDIGRVQVHPHGHGFPITSSITDWKWTCE
ncbi:ABC transporter substrate-binding protein [Pontibaca salina]|uniref:ABC transporter substrate-binding protein n=1 Tax=Pontibaca salina TaxID=2795731 RepID=A0A934HSL4_9RHOB|nr:ABC transporter substrate-binding protein [Pontibaca salina]MBI6629945.1 ABC transporter substrate-binding protein [Pontibaca salina]